jgi:phosphate transport system permease protein
MTPPTLTPPETRGPLPGKAIKRARRRLMSTTFHAVCALTGVLAVAVLAVLLVSISIKGIGVLDWDFLTGGGSYLADEAGFGPAITGSIWLCGIVLVVGMPLGVGAAIYLEEFASRGPLSRFIRVNIANLAGVPSVVYGLIGLATFVGFWNLFGGDDPEYRLLGGLVNIPFGRTVLAGGLTLTLLVLPIVIIASTEALRAVPSSQREAALAMGATRWQSVRRAVLPLALPGILTGSILAMSRAIGETAPILVAGAAAFYLSHPSGLMSQYTAMPMQIYGWVSEPGDAFQERAAAGIIVLIAVLLALNAAAITIRAFAQRKQQP